ncbi:MAG TPA: hypothetical protein VM901_11390 [Bdellovibrionota bacterium]|jgi:hypothetical protein|nr:hypothetical protein [Bdellovibrionota bacterium]
MKRFVLNLALAFSVLPGMAMAEDVEPALPTKVKYLVPGSVSPNGKYVLAAYEQKTKFGEGENTWESEVAFYIAKVNGSKLEIASDMILNWGNEEVDVRGYGPAVDAWSHDSDEENSRISNYAVINNQSRKHNQYWFVRLVNGKYVKQGYDEDKYTKFADAALEEGLKKLGLEGFKSFHRMGGTMLTAEAPKSEDEIQTIDEDSMYEAIHFEKPIYVVSSYVHDVYKTDDKGETIGDPRSINVLGVVKIEKDENGNLKDTKVSFTTEEIE